MLSLTEHSRNRLLQCFDTHNLCLDRRQLQLAVRYNEFAEAQINAIHNPALGRADAAHLACKTNLTKDEDTLRQRPVTLAGNKRCRYRQICRRLINLHATNYVDISIINAKV